MVTHNRLNAEPADGLQPVDIKLMLDGTMVPVFEVTELPYPEGGEDWHNDATCTNVTKPCNCFRSSFVWVTLAISWIGCAGLGLALGAMLWG